MENLAVALAVLNLAALLVVLFLLWRRQVSPNGDAASQDLGSEIAAGQQRFAADISERIVRSTGEIQQSVADGLGKGLLAMQDRLDRRIESLEARNAQGMELVRTKVDERLSLIGQSVGQKLTENLQTGFQQFQKIQEVLKGAEQQLAAVGEIGKSVQDLNSLLKLPHLRGGFGEAIMEQVLAEYLPASLYALQAQLDPGSRDRVDAVLKLPDGKVLPIDSKFPKEQVISLFQLASDPKKLEEARKRLSQVARAQAKSIREKYVRPDLGTTTQALMFLPSETLYTEVIRDAELWEALAGMQVFPVSPNTFAVTLHLFSLGYDHYRMAQGVGKLREEILKARKHFDVFRERFQEVGTALEKAQSAHQVAVSHLRNYEGAVTRLTGEAGSSAIEAPRPEGGPPRAAGAAAG